MSDFLARLGSEVLVLDGAMGTFLFAAGLDDGGCPELWNVTRPETVQRIHAAYLDAGADVVETNTFGATRLKLAPYGLEGRARELCVAGARLARAVCPPGRYVAGAIGPTGHLLAPLGDTAPEAAFAGFREQALALAEGGVDLLAVETMMSPEEAVLAVRAAKAATGLPVSAAMAFQWGRDKGIDRTLWGTTPGEAARRLRDAGADLVGCNCGDGGPARAAVIVAEMQRTGPGPLVAYPNAGLPRLVSDRTVYDLEPDGVVDAYRPILEADVRLVGACCGSTPEHIRRLARLVHGASVLAPSPR